MFCRYYHFNTIKLCIGNRLVEYKDFEGRLKAIKTFHEKLVRTKIQDPT